MKNLLSRILVLLIMLFTFTSCELVKGIFKAGMGIGIFITVLIVAVIVYIMTKIGKKNP